MKVVKGRAIVCEMFCKYKNKDFKQKSSSSVISSIFLYM